MPESSIPRPGQVGTLPRSGTVPQNRRNSRFANIITVLILLATLVLLGFSIYVAYTVFNIGKGGAQTPVLSLVNVPDLKNKTWTAALSTATSAGFQLKSQDGSTDGIVVSQNPGAGDQASSGSTIEVLMQVQKATVPSIPKNSSLATVELILTNNGFKYVVISAGRDPNLQPNTVSRISPSSGSSVALGSKITIYVLNYTNGTPVVTPPPLPTAKPSPTLSPTPKPSPTSSPSPSPTPDPTPDPTP
jgi:serine/threonine-protein kinase